MKAIFQYCGISLSHDTQQSECAVLPGRSAACRSAWAVATLTPCLSSSGSFGRPRRYMASLVLVAADQLRIVCTAVVELPFALDSTLAGVAWIRLPRFLATELDGFNKWHRQMVTDSCLLTNKLPHYERCGVIWHHETNLVICKCKQFWYCIKIQHNV
jgi:hypothetical protein